MRVRCALALLLATACSGTTDDGVELVIPTPNRDGGVRDGGVRDAGIRDAGAMTGTPIAEVDERVDFGIAAVGDAVTRSLLLRNVGDGPLRLTGVDRGVPFDPAFSFASNGEQVPPGGAVEIFVAFAPEDLRDYQARIVLRFDQVDDVEVELIGTGNVPTIVTTQTVVSFGDVAVGTVATLGFVVANTGNVDATVRIGGEQNVRLCSDSSNPSVFCIRLSDRTIAIGGTFVLQAGESTELEVDFAPFIAGTRERGAFTLSSCRISACDLEIRIEGLGIEATLACAPSPLGFGQIPPGQCATRTLGCTNVSNGSEVILGWRIEPNPSPFAADPPSVRVLSPGQALALDVTFCPTLGGPANARVRIERDQGDDVIVALSGSGG